MLAIGVFLAISICTLLLGKGESNAVRDPNRKWRNGIVPYAFDSSTDAAFRAVFASAMKEIETQTCIKFVQRYNEQNWINISKSSSTCSSNAVGMKLSAGPQDLKLGGTCYNDHHDAVHELMHNLGFYHEASRYDRDDYLTIFWEIIPELYKPNFNKKDSTETTNLNTVYDWGSVMQYEAKGFTINGNPSIESKPVGHFLGNRYTWVSNNGLSPTDALKINLLYDCKTNGGAKPYGGWCSDTNPLCTTWASNGDCGRNPAWLNTNCRKSCRQC